MARFIEAAGLIGALVMAATPLVAVGGVAHAAEASQQPVRIQVGDLDFNRAQDVKLFDQRVERASRDFCGQASAVSLQDANACRRAVREEAVQQLAPAQVRDMVAVKSPPMSLASR